MFGSFLPSLWSSINHSLLGPRSRHCYAIKWNFHRRRQNRYAYLAPEDTLAAVERFDQPTEAPTDTTTDTSAFQQPAVQPIVLQ